MPGKPATDRARPGPKIRCIQAGFGSILDAAAELTPKEEHRVARLQRALG